ncbi:hypothetical protein CIP107550_02222 [Corynebacterium diphtheriae]|nr:hypothetical protein CIP107550_02222 [Corynebacterium diphtheriae]
MRRYDASGNDDGGITIRIVLGLSLDTIGLRQYLRGQRLFRRPRAMISPAFITTMESE